MDAIQIGGKEYKMRLGLRALAVFENGVGKKFQPSQMTTFELASFLWCILVTTNEDFPYSPQELLKEIDSDFDTYSKYLDWLSVNWEKACRVKEELKEELPEKEEQKKKSNRKPQKS
jgi:hypothetical protein